MCSYPSFFFSHGSFRNLGNKWAQEDAESMLPPSGGEYYNHDFMLELEFQHSLLCQYMNLSYSLARVELSPCFTVKFTS